MVKSIQVLIVDDQPRARQSMRALIATCPEVDGIREAVNGHEAIRLVEESQPDVVLMDVLMPELDGLEATRRIKSRWEQVKVVLLSMYDEYLNAAEEAGADAFVTKGEPAQRLVSILSRMADENGLEVSNSSGPGGEK